MTDTRLNSFIQRIQNLNEEKKTIQNDIKEVYGEAKGGGYDTKIIRTVIRLLDMPEDEREEQEALIERYMDAINTTKVSVE